MAKVNIWGRNPTGKITAFAIGVPTALVPEYRERAERDGWTDLLTNKYEPWVSSDEPTSPPKNETTSSTSAGSSTASAVASPPSRRKASRTR